MSFLRMLMLAWALGLTMATWGACVDEPHHDFSFACTQTDTSCPKGQWCNPQDWCCHTRDTKSDFPLYACSLVPGGTESLASSNSTQASVSDESKATQSASMSTTAGW